MQISNFMFSILVILIVLIVYFSRYWYFCGLDKSFIINTLVRGCARWSAASLQDKSPLIAVLHANYAAGYLWALKDTFSDSDVKNVTGVNMIEFQKRITDIQDISTKRMISSCPKYASEINSYFGKIGGEL